MKLRQRARSPRSQEEFLRELTDLLTCGLDVSYALHTMTRLGGDRGVQARFMYDAIVTHGSTVGSALRELDYPFDVTAYLASGEATGAVDEALGKITKRMTRRRELRESVWKVIAYPILLYGMCIGVTWFLSLVVIPRFSSLYLTLAPRAGLSFAWIAVTAQIVAWMLTAGGLGAAFLYTTLSIPRLGWGQMFVTYLLHARWSRRIARMIMARQVMEMLSLLLSGHVDLLSALVLLRDQGMWYHSEVWQSVVQDIKAGEVFSATVKRYLLFPDTAVEMIRLAEETGDLVTGATRVHQWLDKTIILYRERALKIVEPSCIALLGCIVGGLTLLMMLPMMTIIDKLS